MDIRVSSVMHAPKLADNWADRVISLLSDHDDAITFNVPHLLIRCDDTAIVSDPWAPMIDDIQMALDFGKLGKRVLVHCYGGVSRSTAVALGLLVQDGMNVDDAVNHIHTFSPNMSPNHLILRHIDDILGCADKFKRDVLSAVAMLPKDLMLWCNDCGVHFKDGDNCPGNHWLAG